VYIPGKCIQFDIEAPGLPHADRMSLVVRGTTDEQMALEALQVFLVQAGRAVEQVPLTSWPKVYCAMPGGESAHLKLTQPKPGK
jgi:hypothetical protein